MPLTINIVKLEREDLELIGELPAVDLEIEGIDELVHAKSPLKYELEVQKLEESVLVQGELELLLTCECARCLKPFSYDLRVEGWACHLPLEGDDAVIITNDLVDLTPFIREDILLSFPQHPLCKPDCAGLPKEAAGKKKKSSGAGQTKDESSAWAALNKLKL